MAEAVSASIHADGPRLLIVNKFGKIEADGGGMRGAIAEAVDLGIPVWSARAGAQPRPWRAFAGPLAVELPAVPAAVIAWLEGHGLPAGETVRVRQRCAPPDVQGACHGRRHTRPRGPCARRHSLEGGVAFVTAVVLPERRLACSRQSSAASRAGESLGSLVGLSGAYMAERLDIWHRFVEPAGWWLAAMALLWLLFMVILFVVEPLLARDWFERQSTNDPNGTIRLLQRAH